MIGPNSWAQDAIAVMNAVGSEQATIFAPGFTSLAGLVLAADFPDRVNNLVIFNGGARTLHSDDYPIGSELGDAERFTTIGIEPDAVEHGFDILGIIAPSVAGDDAFRCVVGSRRQPRRVSQHGPRLHQEDPGGRCARHTRTHRRPRR